MIIACENALTTITTATMIITREEVNRSMSDE